jgi:hypothetical protein
VPQRERGWTHDFLMPSLALCQLQGPPRDAFLPLPNGLTYKVLVTKLLLIKDVKLTSGG